jgi:hypothetical protein
LDPRILCETQRAKLLLNKAMVDQLCNSLRGQNRSPFHPNSIQKITKIIEETFHSKLNASISQSANSCSII